MTKIKIILADSHGPVMGKDQTSANLSLLYLSAYLKEKAEYPVEFLYIPQSKSGQFHLDSIKQMQPEIYAVSFTSYSALVTYELIKKIKIEYPKVLVVCGGSHATQAYKDILEKSGADICVMGEGEQTFLEIANRIEKIHEIKKDIKGIAYLENDVCLKTPGRELINEIDSIPFPMRELVTDSDFVGLTYSKARPNTEMVVTRGCPLRCVFCANPVFRLKNGPPFRSRSPENIIKEVKELYKLGYREIYLHSDELNVSLGWSIDVCKAIASLGFKDLYFQCNLRVVPVNEELAMWMKKANFWLVRIGLETTSNRVLKGIKKEMSFEKTQKACKILSKQGIKIYAFTMLFNFWEENGHLQHETPAEVKQTIRDTYKLWIRGHLHYANWAFAVPIQGAEFYDIALKRKMIDSDYYPTDTWDSFEFLEGVSKKTFNKIFASARRQQALMAITSGNFEWRNYKGIARKALTMLRGKPD